VSSSLDYVLDNLRAAKPALRNAARAWILHRFANEGRSPTARQLGDTLGLSPERATIYLGRLVEAGLLRRRGMQMKCWSLCDWNRFVSLFDLLEALGREMEPDPKSRCNALALQPERHCSACGGLIERPGRCALCAILDRRPAGWLDRLRRYAERAEAGQPLFVEGV
jgi:hypothetical protein